MYKGFQGGEMMSASRTAARVMVFAGGELQGGEGEGNYRWGGDRGIDAESMFSFDLPARLKLHNQ